MKWLEGFALLFHQSVDNKVIQVVVESQYEPKENPYSPKEIWNAYGTLPKSGLFPYLSITNSPNAVKFTVDNSSQLVTKNISIASSLIEPFHWLERISFNFNIGLIVKNLLSPYKKFLSMNGDKPLCSDRVDIIIIIEYFSKNTIF